MEVLIYWIGEDAEPETVELDALPQVENLLYRGDKAYKVEKVAFDLDKGGAVQIWAKPGNYELLFSGKVKRRSSSG